MKHPRALTLGATSMLFMALPAASQTAPLQYQRRPHALDSGPHDNATDRMQVVFQAIVHAPRAPWMRFLVDKFRFPGESHLVVVSALDGASHRLDATELARWGSGSAYLNGDMLLVRLVAGPRTAGVRVTTTHVEVGVRGRQHAPLSLCDGNDTRVASTDARVARVLPVGCTAFLVSTTNCFLSAGHCCRDAGFQTVQFNVPPSLPDGTLQHPGPEEQYRVEVSTILHQDGGNPGADWCYFRTLRNATTGLHAGERQGAAFTVDIPPAMPRTIRITGYGSAPGVRNQTQQEATGPMAATGDTVRYRTDTEPGNSGSPIIDVATGNAVGAHTHGGCTATGGANAGTGYGQRLLNGIARNALPYVCASTDNASLQATAELPSRLAGRIVLDVAGPAGGSAVLLGTVGAATWCPPAPTPFGGLILDAFQLFVVGIAALDGSGAVQVPIDFPATFDLGNLFPTYFQALTLDASVARLRLTHAAGVFYDGFPSPVIPRGSISYSPDTARWNVTIWSGPQENPQPTRMRVRHLPLGVPTIVLAERPIAGGTASATGIVAMAPGDMLEVELFYPVGAPGAGFWNVVNSGAHPLNLFCR